MFRRSLIRKQVDLGIEYNHLTIWYRNIIDEISKVKLGSDINDADTLAYIRKLEKAKKKAKRRKSKIYRKMFRLYVNYGITSPYLDIRV